MDPDSRLASASWSARAWVRPPKLLVDVKPHQGGRTLDLITSNEWSAYPEAIRRMFGAGHGVALAGLTDHVWSLRE